MRELTKTEMESMLGRLVSSYGITHTVLKVEPLPYGSARLYIATDKKNGRWDGRWVPAHMVSEPGHTILHWHWRTDYREDASRCEELYQHTVASVAQAHEKARRKAKEEDDMYARRREVMTRITPAWAKACIVARLHEDRSEPMSDYYGSRVVREVLLAFSKTERNSFPEMRKAASRFEPAADLAGPEGEEHRENYSMGRGYYLKRKGVSYYAGWEVRKMTIFRDHPLALETEHFLSLE